MSSTLGEMHKVCRYHHFVTKQLFLSRDAQCCNKDCCECQLVRSGDGNLTQNGDLRVGNWLLKTENVKFPLRCPPPILGQTIDRCITLTSSQIATASSMSRLMEDFCLTQRILMPLFLTPAVRICRVRSLKEGKYQLPIAIFDVRDVTFA